MALHFQLFKINLSQNVIDYLLLISGGLTDVIINFPQFSNPDLLEVKRLISITNFNISQLSRKYLRGSCLSTSYELNLCVLNLSTAIEILKEDVNPKYQKCFLKLPVLLKDLISILDNCYAEFELAKFESKD